jgi:CRISPR-associated protein Cas1
VLLDLPAVNVDQVMLFGRNQVSPAAWICCAQHDIPVAHLSRMGKFYGRFEPPTGNTSRLLMNQFTAQAAGNLDLPLAREFVRGKLTNSVLLVTRYARNRKSEQDNRIHESIKVLRDLAHRTKTATTLESLRGLEGAGAAAYFGTWRIWLAPTWKFGARQQQDGADPVNALLDFGYTLLYQSAAGLIQARGLNPWVGHLHRAASGHMALASDVMEEFRAMVVDSVVLHTCLNHRLEITDFVTQQGTYTLRTEAARWFVREIETRLNTERQHPASGELLDLRRIMDGQVRALATCYRQGRSDIYTTCVFR